MNDIFKSHVTGLTAPAQDAAPIIPSDTTDLPQASRAIYVGAAGDLSVRLVGGSEVTFIGTVAGAIYPIRAERVMSTGTSAASLIALW